jgi:microcystin-dependent protein
MADQFLGEIRMFGCNFAPNGWALCNGQLLSISQNTALFSLLGTTYGGDGRTNFALPNLQGSAPMHFDQGPGLTARTQGETGGSPTVTLQSNQMPPHTHGLNCTSSTANQTSPADNVPAAGAGQRGSKFYASTPGTSPAMKSDLLSPAGGNQPHNNMPPYLAVNFCIALTGIYPSRP